MRKTPNPKVERFRVRGNGPFSSDMSYGNNGAFAIPGPDGGVLICICSDGCDWEHVSVHGEVSGGQQYTPSWAEMDFIKQLFFEDDEVVMQLHPAKKDYINVHENTLHLWSPRKQKIPLPPKVMV